MAGPAAGANLTMNASRFLRSGYRLLDSALTVGGAIRARQDHSRQIRIIEGAREWYPSKMCQLRRMAMRNRAVEESGCTNSL
jgi:hypothetical protein